MVGPPDMRGTALERIPYGASVLCRQGRVSLASEEVANGIAATPPKWMQQDGGYSPGDWLKVAPFADWSAKNLQAVADGPIMDSNRIYLPAGKFSEEEYQ
jgi:hypothetical protein